MFRTVPLKYSYFLLVWCCGLLAALIFLMSSRVDTGTFDLVHANSRIEKVDLPLLRGGPGIAATYELKGNIHFGWFSSKKLHITPDNLIQKIKINGQPVDLSSISKASLGDFNNGFALDVSQYVVVGKNHLYIQFWDDGIGRMGVSVLKSSAESGQYLILIYLLIAVSLLAWLLFARGVPVGHIFWYCLVALGIGLRVWVVLEYNPVDHIWSDAKRHWDQGRDSLRIDLMSMADPIIYQLYIGVLAKLTLKIPALVAFYTILLSVCTTWIWYRFFRELQQNKTIALVGCAFIAFLPSWVSIYSYFMQETLFLPLFGGALWATWRARRKETPSSFIIMAVLWALAGLTRGIAIPLAAVSCIYLWSFQQYKLKKLVLSVLALALILGPLTYRTYSAIGLFSPNGLGHVVALYALSGKREIILKTERQGAVWTHGFWSPSFGAKPFSPLSDWQSRRKGRFYVDIDFDEGRRDWDLHYKKLESTWRDKAWIIKENLILLFFAPSWPDNNPARTVDVTSIHLRWVWAPLGLCILLWTLFIRKKLKGQWLLPLLVLTWFVVQGLLPISVNEGRYRKPFEGLVIAQFVLLFAVSFGASRAGRLQSLKFGYLARLIEFKRNILKNTDSEKTDV